MRANLLVRHRRNPSAGRRDQLRPFRNGEVTVRPKPRVHSLTLTNPSAPSPSVRTTLLDPSCQCSHDVPTFGPCLLEFLVWESSSAAPFCPPAPTSPKGLLTTTICAGAPLVSLCSRQPCLRTITLRFYLPDTPAATTSLIEQYKVVIESAYVLPQSTLLHRDPSAVAISSKLPATLGSYSVLLPRREPRW
jgi:hypothetical protein